MAINRTAEPPRVRNASLDDQSPALQSRWSDVNTIPQGGLLDDDGNEKGGNLHLRASCKNPQRTHPGFRLLGEMPLPRPAAGVQAFVSAKIVVGRPYDGLQLAALSTGPEYTATSQAG